MDKNKKSASNVSKKPSVKKQLKNEKSKHSETKNLTQIKTIKRNKKTTSKTASNKDKEIDNDEVNLKDEFEEIYVNDYREIKDKYDINNNKSQKVLTDYELAVLIGNRATQLALNAPPLIDNIEGMNHIEIAEEELRQKKSPFLLCRTIGNKEEYYKLDDIIVEDF